MIGSIKSIISPRFLKFITVGFINTGINYSVFFILLRLFLVNYKIAGAVGFLSGAVSGFFFNRNYTFQADTGITAGMIKYLAVQLFCLGVHMLVIITLTEFVNIPKELSQIGGIAVTTFTNYFLIKKLVFNGAGGNESSSIKI